MNLFNLADGELEDGPEGRGFRLVRVAAGFDAKLTGLTVYELEPGEKNWPYHFELNEEEWVILLSGSVVVRTPDGETVLREGDTMCFPPGPSGAHALRNDGDAVARFAMPSSIAQLGDATVYPDSNKVKVAFPGGFRRMVSLDQELDYWEGEE